MPVAKKVVRLPPKIIKFINQPNISVLPTGMHDQRKRHFELIRAMESPRGHALVIQERIKALAERGNQRALKSPTQIHHQARKFIELTSFSADEAERACQQYGVPFNWNEFFVKSLHQNQRLIPEPVRVEIRRMLFENVRTNHFKPKKKKKFNPIGFESIRRDLECSKKE